jgi:hypothetical protein
MLGIFRRFFGSPTVLSPEQTEALNKAGLGDAGATATDAATRAVNQKEKGLRCPKGHPLHPGQRNEDCFDCYLLGLMAAERNGLPADKGEATIVGALLCLNGFHRGATFPIMLAEDVPLIIGADPDCDLVLSDERISRRHISMVRRQGRTTVRDLNSLHHSAMRAEGELQWYVLDPEREYWFRDGCHIMLGDVEFLFRATDEQARKLSAAAG